MKISTPRYVEMLIARYRAVLKKCWAINVSVHASAIGIVALGAAALVPADAISAELNDAIYAERQVINLNGPLVGAISVVSKDTLELNTSAKPATLGADAVIKSDALVVNFDMSDDGLTSYYAIEPGANTQIYGNVITNLITSVYNPGSQVKDPEFVGTAYSGSNPTVFGNSVINIGVKGAPNADVSFSGGNIIGSGAGVVNGNSQINVNSGTVKVESLVGGGAWGGLVKGDSSVNISGGEVTLATDKPERRGVYGGSYAVVGGDAVVKGDSSVNVSGGKVTGSVYGGGYGADASNKAVTEGNSSVSISGSSTVVDGNVYGGGNNFADVKGDSTVTLQDGTVTGHIYAGGRNSNVAGSVIANILSGSAGRVYGAALSTPGGTLEIGKDINLNLTNVDVGRVGGVKVDGGTAYIKGKILINSAANIQGPLYGAGQAWDGGSIEVANGVEVNITGGSVAEDVTGGGFVRTDVDANVEANPGHITIAGGTKVNITGGDVKDVYGGTHSYSLGGKLATTSNITGGTLVRITGGNVGDVYGGGNTAWGSQSTIDTTWVDVSNVKIGDIIGGGYVVGGGKDANGFNSSTITGDTKITMNNASAEIVVGGGWVNWVVGTGISVVNGNTSIDMVNSTVGDLYCGGIALAHSSDGAAGTIKSNVEGNTSINLTGGKITGNLIGGGAALDFYDRKLKLIANVDGSTLVRLNNVEVDGSISGGGGLIGSINAGSSANVGGNTVLELTNVTGHDNVFGGGFGTENAPGSNVVKGSTFVTVQGGSYDKAIAGGGWYSNVLGSTKVNVTDAVVHAGIIGGGAYGMSSTGNTDVYVGGSTKIDGAGSGWGAVIGGGQGAGTSNGNTNIVIEGNTEISGAWIDEGGDGKDHGYVFGGGWSSVTNGNTNVLVQGNANVATWVVGGGTCNDNNDADYGLVQGNTNVVIGGNAVIGNGDSASSGTNGYVIGGGWLQDVVGSSSVTLKDNAIIERSIYGGGFQSSIGGTRVLITGGTVGRADKIYSDVVGGGYAGDVKGDTYVEITGGKIYGSVYGGGSDGGNVTGNTGIKITGGVIDGGVYAGAQGNGTISGTSSVSISGAMINGDIVGLGSGKTSSLQFSIAGNYADTIKDFSSVTINNNNMFSGSISGIADKGLTLNNETAGVVSGSISGTNVSIYDHGVSGAWNNATIVAGSTGTMYSSLSAKDLATAYAKVNGLGNSLVIGGDSTNSVKLAGATVVEDNNINSNTSLDDLSDGNNNVTFSNDIVINDAGSTSASEVNLASNMTTMQNISSTSDVGLVIKDAEGASSSIKGISATGELAVVNLQENSSIGTLASEKSVSVQSNAGSIGNIVAKEDVLIGYADAKTAITAQANTGAIGDITGRNVSVNNAAGADKYFGNIVATEDVVLTNTQEGHIAGAVISGSSVSLENDGHFAGIINAYKFAVRKNTSQNTLIALVQNATEIHASNDVNGVAEITNASDHLSTLKLTQAAGTSNTFTFINAGTINADVVFEGSTDNTYYIATANSVTNSKIVTAGSVLFQSGSTLTSDGSTVINAADKLTVESGAKLDYTGSKDKGTTMVSVGDALMADQMLNFSLPALIRAVIDGSGLVIAGLGNYQTSVNSAFQGVGAQMDAGGYEQFDSLTQSELDAVAYSLSPDIYTVLPKVILDSSRSTYSNILRNNMRLRADAATNNSNNDTASGAGAVNSDSIEHDWNLFLTGHGTYTNEQDRGVRSGYSASGSNYTIGATKYLGENAMFGVALDYGYTKVNMSRDAGSDAKINSLRPIVFFGVTSESGFDVDAAVGYGYHDSSVNRNFELGSDTAYNKESFNTNEFSGMLNVGYKLKLTEKMILEPIAGVYFGYLHNGSVSEKSTNSLSQLNADSSNSWSLQTSLGARLYYTMDVTDNVSFTPEFYALWQHEFGDRSFDRTFSLNGNAFSSSYAGIRYGRDFANFGVRFSTEIDKAWTVSAEYNAILGQDSFGNNFGVSINYSF